MKALLTYDLITYGFIIPKLPNFIIFAGLLLSLYSRSLSDIHSKHYLTVIKYVIFAHALSFY